MIFRLASLVSNRRPPARSRTSRPGAIDSGRRRESKQDPPRRAVILTRVHDSREEKVAALKKVPLLSGIDDDELNALAQEVAVRTFKMGDELVKEGVLGSEVFFVVEGSCEVLRGKKHVASLGP